MTALTVGGAITATTGKVLYDRFAELTGWSSMHTLWPGNFSAPVSDGSSVGYSDPEDAPATFLIYQDFGTADNFRIVVRREVIDDPALSALNQCGAAVFVDPTVPDQDLELAMVGVADFTLGDDCYWNNVANCDRDTFNENWETMSLIYTAGPPYPSYTAGVIYPTTFDTRVVGGEMSFRINGQQMGDPIAIPEAYVGRTRHGLVHRRGFTVSRISDLFTFEHYTGPL